MSDQAIGARDAAMLVIACAAGVVVAPQLPYVGLPVTAAAAAGLTYRGRPAFSIGAMTIGAVLSWAVFPQSVAFVAPVAFALLLAVWLLRDRPAQLVGLGLAAAITASAVLADALSARAAGQTLVGAMQVQAVSVTDALKQALGASGGALADQLASLRPVLISLWPSFYVQSAIYATVFVIAAISWAARRSGAKVTVPAARNLDLTVHAIWPLVIGLVAVAAATVLGANAAAARAIGFNALYVARALFFLQGAAVFSALFDVPKRGYGKMVALYAILWVFDQLLLVVSLVGMLDFWANFRRLPRESPATAVALEEPPDSI